MRQLHRPTPGSGLLPRFVPRQMASWYTPTGHKKKPLMNADKRGYLNSGFASASICVHRRLLVFLGVVARGLLARERLPFWVDLADLYLKCRRFLSWFITS